CSSRTSCSGFPSSSPTAAMSLTMARANARRTGTSRCRSRATSRSDMRGYCLCRRVTVEIDRAPEYINICNCDFCRKRGAAWAYFRIAEAKVAGTTHEYRREDIDDVWLIGHHCPTCGTTTHYTFVPEHATDRV